jgi:small subunit ribosomal protein S13
MVRISGIDLPAEKKVEIGLSNIYGIGRSTAVKILSETGVSESLRIKDLTEIDVSKLRKYIDQNCKVEGNLRRDIAFDIKRLKEIKSYRGMRHRQGLPVRGQRSKTNARTRKGPKKIVANKKK